VVLSWEVLPTRAKHREDVVLVRVGAEEGTVDTLLSHSVRRYSAEDWCRVTLPPELELGVMYEFRWCTFSAESTYGPTTACSQRFRVVPRRGMQDHGGTISLSVLSVGTDTHGSESPPARDSLGRLVVGGDGGRGVEVAWSGVPAGAAVAAVAAAPSGDGDGEDGDDGASASACTECCSEFLGVFRPEDLRTHQYAYYWDPPGDGSQRVTVSAYAIETQLEPNAVYVFRFVRDKVIVAQSEPFVVSASPDTKAAAATVDDGPQVEEEGEEAAVAAAAAVVACDAASARRLAIDVQGGDGNLIRADADTVDILIHATPGGAASISDYDYVALYAESEADAGNYLAYAYVSSNDADGGDTVLASIDISGGSTLEPGGRYVARYVNGNTTAWVGAGAVVRVQETLESE
jgi:hypothetical protein